MFGLQIPDHFNADGNETPYTLTVEGNIYGGQHGSLFLHQRPLTLMQPDVQIVLESEHPTYLQGQTSKLLQLPITTRTTFIGSYNWVPKNYARKLMKSQRNSFAKVFYRRLKDPQEVEKTFFISLFNVKIEHLTLNKKERHKNFV